MSLTKKLGKLAISGRALTILCCPYVYVNAATITVPDDYRRIQGAINASSDGDEIIVADGIYYPDSTAGIDFGAKAITL